MGLKMMGEVYRLKLEPTSKFILLTLADACSGTLEAVAITGVGCSVQTTMSE